ncbi:MAG: hypothetical protein ACRDXE_05015, partial [Acidimicrobiales bacterium]
MNESERKRFLEALQGDEQFRAAVRREILTEELLALPAVVAASSAAVNALIDQAAEFQGGLATLTEQVAALANGVTKTQEDLRALVGTTRRLLTVSQEGFAEMHQGFAEMRQGFAEMRQGFAETDRRFTALET